MRPVASAGDLSADELLAAGYPPSEPVKLTPCTLPLSYWQDHGASALGTFTVTNVPASAVKTSIAETLL